MIRKVLTAIALTATLGGCVTGFGYREGAGDYYYGSPSVEYDYYGAPYGSTYYGGGLGYGYGGYGYGGGYGGGFGYGGYGGYGYGGYPYYYGVPYYYYVPRPSHPPRGGWDGNGPRQGTRPGHPPPTASRPYPGYPKNVGPDAEPNGRMIRRQGGAFVPQRIGQDTRPVPRQWAPAERGGNPRSQQQPAQRMFQRPEASNFESRQRPTQQQPFRSSTRPSAAPMRSAPAPSPASGPRGGDFRRNQDR